MYGGVWWCMAVYAAAWWLKPVGGCCAGGVRLYAVTLWLMITCIYAHVSDGVKWHRPRAHGGAWWCTVVYAALAGWAAGRLGVWWCGVYGLCVQRVQWCAGQTGVACDIGGGGVPKYCSKKTTPTTSFCHYPLSKPLWTGHMPHVTHQTTCHMSLIRRLTHHS